jgi:uncharacterized membrane protein YfcA
MRTRPPASPVACAGKLLRRWPARLDRQPAVTDFFPDSATFAAALADPRFPAALAISILSGVVRGFSGFGSALVYVPLMSTLYGPRVAAPSMLVIDVITGAAFLLSVWRRAVWREILPLAVAALVAAQFGSLILLYADPTVMRWAIVAVVLAVVVVLASGWRYRGRPLLVVTIGVGMLSGLLASAMQISGPPVIVYWLGSASDAALMRGNFAAYFAVLAFGVGVSYWIQGLLTAEATALALLIGPLHIVAMYAGARLFHVASDQTYRRAAYGIITMSALLGMPLFDRWLR